MANKRRASLVGLIASIVVVVGAPAIGALVSALLVQRSFHRVEGVEPSEKARVLAEGISAAMNGAAFGIFVSLVALVTTAVFAVRLVRERRAPPE